MRQIRLVPDPILRRPTRPIHRFGPVLAHLVGDMKDICEAHHGLGLSAPQIGVSSEVIVARDTFGELVALINPFPVSWYGRETMIEGCLSIPGAAVPVERAECITVVYQDIQGRTLSLTANGLFARVLQHEIDHLDGVLITDYAQDHHPLTSQTPAARRSRPLQSRDRGHAQLVH